MTALIARATERLLPLALAVCLLASASMIPAVPVHAQTDEPVTFGFELCPGNSDDEEIGEEQLSVVIRDVAHSVGNSSRNRQRRVQRLPQHLARWAI